MKAHHVFATTIAWLAASGCSIATQDGDGTNVSTSADTARTCNVLVAMSDADTLTAVGVSPFTFWKTKSFRFGYLLDEMAIPVRALLDAGCRVTFANPTGTEPPRDPEGDTPLYFIDGLPQADRGSPPLLAFEARLRFDRLIPGSAAHAELADALALVRAPSSPILGHGTGSFDAPHRFSDFVGDDGEARAETLTKYDAIFVPGGYAPMLNLWNDAQLGAILRHFHQEQKLTVTLCRGGVALRSAATDDGWIYDGYAMTTYATIEDDLASFLAKVLPLYDLPFHPNEKLREAGARLDLRPFYAHVVEDRELLTGENQWSAHLLADRFIASLRERGVPTTTGTR